MMEAPPPSSRYAVRVRFAETDLMGIAHHACYWAWLEAARGEFLRRRGVSFAEVAATGRGLAVVEASIRYKRPTRYDDLVLIDVTLESHTRATCTMSYRLWVRDGGGAERLVAEARTTLASVGPGGAPRRLDAELVEALLRGEQHPRDPELV